MIESVDTRIVEMKFDNKEFERGVKETLNSLDDLKKSLEFKETDKPLDEVTASLEQMNSKLSSMADSVQTITNRMTTVLGKAIDEITTKISRMGLNLAKSLSVDNISAGFAKYNDYTTNVQTITSARPELKVKQIEGYMGALLKYSDETSYSFTQMSTALSTFLSNGQDMDESISAIQGIGNACAHAGIQASNAQIVFRNISDAMSLGKLQLQDWKSLEIAKLTTESFKEELIAAGVAEGKLEKKVVNGSNVYYTKVGKRMEVTTKNIRESLSTGWVTDKVMLSAFKVYADNTQGIGKTAYEAAQKCKTFTDVIEAVKDAVATGWMTSYEYIFGDLNEAIELWSDLCAAIQSVTSPIAEVRNLILSKWKKLGGRNTMLGGIYEMFSQIAKVAEPAKKAIQTVLDPLNLMDGVFSKFETGVEWLDNLVNGTANYVDDESMNQHLEELQKQGYKTYRSIQEVAEATEGIDTGIDWLEAYKEEMKQTGFSRMFGHALDDISDKFEAFTKQVTNWLESPIEEEGKTRAEILGDIVGGIAAAIRLAGKVIGEVVNFFKKVAAALLPVVDGILLVFDSLGLGLINLNSEASKSTGFSDFLGKVAESLKPLAEAIGSVLTKFAEWISGIKKAFEENEKLSEIWKSIKEFFNGVIALIPKAVTAIGDLATSIYAFFENSELLKNIWSGIKGFVLPIVSTVVNFAKKIADAVGGFFNTGLNGESIKTFWTKVKEAFVNLFPSDWFKAVGDKIKFVGKSIVTGISSFFEKGFSLERLKKVWKTIKTRFALAFPKVKEWASNLWSSITKIWDSIKKWFADGFPNIGDWASGVWEKIKNVAASIGNWFAKAFSAENVHLIWANFTNNVRDSFPKVKEWFSKLGGKISDIWAAVKQWFVDAFPKIKEWAKGIWPAMKRLWASIKEWFATAFPDIKAWMSSTWDKIKGVGRGIGEAFKNLFSNGISLEGIKEFWGRVKQSFIDFFPKASEWVSGVAKKIGKVFTDIFEWIKSLFTSEAADTGLTETDGEGVISEETGKKWGENGVANFFKGIWEGIKGVFNFVSGTITGFIDFLDIKSWNDFIFKIMDLGLALSAFAIPMLIRAFQNFSSGFKTLVKKGRAEDREVDTIGTTLLKIAGAIAIVVAAITVLGYLPENKLRQGIDAFKEILTYIAELVIVVYGGQAIKTIFNAKEGSLSRAIRDFGIGLALVAASALLVLIATGKLVNMCNTLGIGTVIAGILGVIGIMTVLGLLATIMKNKGGSGAMSKDSGLGFLLTAAAAFVIVLAVEKLAKLDVGSGFIALGMIVILLGVLAGISILMGKFNGTMNKGIGVGFLLLAASLYVIALAVCRLSTLDLGSAAIGVGSMLAIMVGMGILAVAMKNLESMSIGGAIKAVLIMAIALVGLGVTLSLVAELISDSISTSLTRIASGLEVSGAMFASASATFESVDVLNFYKISTILQNLFGAYTLYGYGWFDPFSAALTTLSSGLELSATMLSSASGILASVEMTNLNKVPDIISNCKNCLDTYGTDWIDDFVTKIQSLGGGFSNFSSTVSSFEVPDNLQKFFDDLPTLTTNFGAFMNLGLDNLITSITGLGGAIALFGTDIRGTDISSAEGIEASVDNAFALMNAIAEKMPDGLSDTLASVPDATATGTYSANLVALGGALVDFANKVKGIDISDAVGDNGALTLLKKLADEMPTYGGWFSWAEGEQETLSEFANDIEQLAGALSNFAKKATVLDDGTVADYTNALNALTVLKEIQNALPNQGGLIQAIEGTKDLSRFGTGINSLGEGLAGFAKKIKDTGVSPEEMDIAVSAVGALAAIQNALPNEGGILTWVDGQKDFSRFAVGLNSLGEGLAGFATKIKDANIDKDMAKEATEVASELVVIFNKIPASGGLLGLLGGNFSWETFSNGMPELGENLVAFSKSLQGYNPVKSVDEVMLIMKDMAKAASYLGNANLGKITDFSNQLSKTVGGNKANKNDNLLGNSIKAFATSVSDVEITASVERVVSIVRELAYASSILKNGADFSSIKGLDSIGEQVKTFISNFEEVGDVSGARNSVAVLKDVLEILGLVWDVYQSDIMSQGAFDALETFLEDVSDTTLFASIQTFADSLSAGLMDGMTNSEEIPSGVSNLVDEIVIKIRENYSSFYSAGKNIDYGIAAGINSADGYASVIVAAAGIANAALSTVKHTWDEHSPSRAFASLAMLANEGMALGFNQNGSVVIQSVEDVAENAMESAWHLYNVLSTEMLDDINAQPTITPVVDLSNVNESVAAIGGMFSADRSFGISAKAAGYFSRGRNAGTNEAARINYESPDTVNAINALGAKVDELSSKLEGMQVVLDSGIMVGQMAPQLDGALGRMAYRRERGN